MSVQNPASDQSKNSDVTRYRAKRLAWENSSTQQPGRNGFDQFPFWSSLNESLTLQDGVVPFLLIDVVRCVPFLKNQRFVHYGNTEKRK